VKLGGDAEDGIPGFVSTIETHHYCFVHIVVYVGAVFSAERLLGVFHLYIVHLCLRSLFEAGKLRKETEWKKVKKRDGTNTTRTEFLLIVLVRSIDVTNQKYC